jgi:uncharacterized protein YggE
VIGRIDNAGLFAIVEVSVEKSNDDANDYVIQVGLRHDAVLDALNENVVPKRQRTLVLTPIGRAKCCA